MPKQRGITLMTVLIFLGLAAAVYCLFAFGQAYWDNFEVNGILRQAANECYRQPADSAVRILIMNKLHETFDVEVDDGYGKTEKRLPFIFEEGDLQIQRDEILFSRGFRATPTSNYDPANPTRVTSPNSVDPNLRNDITDEIVAGPGER